MITKVAVKPDATADCLIQNFLNMDRSDLRIRMAIKIAKDAWENNVPGTAICTTYYADSLRMSYKNDEDYIVLRVASFIAVGSYPSDNL